MKKLREFTSESVAMGHPDKVCDVISDAILDKYLEQDRNVRLGCEILATKGKVIIAGEASNVSAHIPVEDIARAVIRDIGYEQEGFHWRDVEVENLMHQQSPDIAQGVDQVESKLIGAGDQGLMFGYACRESDELMPAPIYYSHRILEAIASDRSSGKLPGLGPDAKVQLTFGYDGNDPVEIVSIVLSHQHLDEKLNSFDIEEMLMPVIERTLPKGLMTNRTKKYFNPTGKFVIGGPISDAGLTGRKIIVDTYGGYVPHGGGAFSGKDASKVDRSAAYIARYMAKNVVAAKLADRCLIQLAYGIGLSEPISFTIRLDEPDGVSEAQVSKALAQLVDLSPAGIIKHLRLDTPIYRATASFGHFGRPPRINEHGMEEFSWEKTDLVPALIARLG